MSKFPDEYQHSYRIPLTGSNERHQISELTLQRDFLKIEPARLSKQLKMQNPSRHTDREVAHLLGISVHVLGGLAQFPKWAKSYFDDYLLLLVGHLMKSLHNFDPTKGNWPGQVRWSRVSARRDLLRSILATKAEKKAIERLLDEAEAIGLMPVVDGAGTDDLTEA